MEDTPLVSIVVTSFRLSAIVLKESLDSLRAQTQPGWEAIVVDDGSADGIARQVVDDLGEHRVRYVEHRSNLGLGAARNTGFRLARAPAIVPLDGDDALAERFLELTLEALGKDPTASYAFADWQCFGGSSEAWRFPDPPHVPCPEHLVIPGPGTLIHRRVWEEIGGYLETTATSGLEDWDFWLSAMERGLSGVHLPLALYRHRLRPNSMSVTAAVSNDHLNRELLYRRHKEAFDSWSGSCPRCPDRHRVASFRARGYATAAAAARARRRRLQAIHLSARAVSIRPDLLTLRELVRSLLPSSVLRSVAMLRRRVSRPTSATEG